MPVPIIARPISDITVRTSAKSTLIRPGRTIRSAMPCTAPSSTSLAARNAWIIVALRPSTVISFSFGIVISESQCWLSSSMPLSATCMRPTAFERKGLVTTATGEDAHLLGQLRHDRCRAGAGAATHAGVMNTMSAPCKRIHDAFAIFQRRLAADFRIRTRARPLVTLLPSCSCSFAPQFLIACASVFAVMNSTPSTLPLTMCARRCRRHRPRRRP
jgi:hypothetical protein